MRYKTTALSAAIAFAISGPAAAGFIDFENAPSLGLSDNDEITDQFDGVTFDGAYLEAEGESDADPQGYVNDQEGEFDLSFDDDLGDWFLRTDGQIRERGGSGVFLSVVFDSPTNVTSGDIWDIDGISDAETEQWNVVALMDGSEVSTEASPLGDSNGDGSLDGLPWRFDIREEGVFNQLNFEFIGSKTEGVGLGFDNFRFTTASVPEPGTLGLLGVGLVGLVAARRRRG